MALTHETARTAATLPEASVAESPVTSIRAEADTDWAPDPWDWAYPARGWFRPNASELLDALKHSPEALVPFLGGRVRAVPLLDPAFRFRLHSLAIRAAQAVDHIMPKGVLAYRAAHHQSDFIHYRVAARQRREYEQRLADEAAFVLITDIRSFFPRTQPEHITEPVGAFDTKLAAELEMLLQMALEVRGYPLPEGYAASRALSNIALSTLDSVIPHPFTRWVDDYRVFVPSETSAHATLNVMRERAAQLGFELSTQKTYVVEVAKASRTPSSLDSDKTLPTKIGSMFAGLAAADPREKERKLRLLLRFAGEARDSAMLERIADLPGGLPATALPRLAFALARCPWSPASERLLDDQLGLSDELSHWRWMRLGYALWYSPTQYIASRTEEIRHAYRHSPIAQPVLARVIAKHTGRAMDYSGDWWHHSSARHLSLARAEADGLAAPLEQPFAPPPIKSYL